ncbi:hypothetical protein K8Q96_01260 [Candidatus Nomurabacteria bacterium]|nr:hypothetical protein [Candidatus Nomurabacteria bacterium]
MKVPAPTWCPDCRFKLRAVWRNEMSLYNRTCIVTGKSIISVYNPKSPYKVVSLDFYNGDQWTPFSFGREYDFSKTFFEQLDSLLKDVYKKALFPISSVGQNIDSDYVNFAGGCKNSYFCFNTAYAENVMYSRGSTNIKDSIDVYYNDHIENCYECVNVYKSNGVFWGQNSTSCIDCIFIENCNNCQDCFGCVNLHNKSFCFFNEQLSKEEYYQRISEYVGSKNGMNIVATLFKSHALKYPKRATQNRNVINCSGDYIFESNNCKNCFETGHSENSKYFFGTRNTKDSYGGTGGIGVTESIENMTANHSNRMIGTVACENSHDIEYSFVLNNCSNFIGCDGLKNSQYCILNKQYTKEEYEKIREHIVNELISLDWYGLIIPPSLSPFAYNETIAQDNMSLTKEEASLLGFRWEDSLQVTKGKETIQLNQIPDSIKDVLVSITSEILSCSNCVRNYKILPQEFVFYKRLNIPIPEICFYCRHSNRIKRRGFLTFYNRNCANCSKEITTNYAPDRPEIVYCKSCYQKEVF